MKQELKEELLLYIKNNSFTYNLSTPFFTTLLNGCFQNILPDIQTFCLGFLRPFAVSFCLCTSETTNTRDTLLPNIVLSVFQFFRFYLILPIFTPPNLKFFSTSIFSEI